MKIAIDLGHGVGQDRGAEGFVTEERIINDVGSKVIEYLRKLGHEVLTVRPNSASSVTDSLVQRVNKANDNNVDLFVSIHANAGGGKGTEVFTYQGKELAQARNVLNNLVRLGFTNRGIKGADPKEYLYVTHYTNMDAMLIEICFTDTQSDIDLYNSIGADKVAQAILSGLVGQAVNIPVSENKATVEPIQANNCSANLRDWQSAYNETYNQNIIVDGIRGPQTEDALSKTLVKEGDTSSLVAWLQCRIGANIDGQFGAQTRAKLIEYQNEHGLVADGLAGRNTFDTLLRQFNN